MQVPSASKIRVSSFERLPSSKSSLTGKLNSNLSAEKVVEKALSAG
jgi:hypothetical protein